MSIKTVFVLALGVYGAIHAYGSMRDLARFQAELNPTISAVVVEAHETSIFLANVPSPPPIPVTYDLLLEKRIAGLTHHEDRKLMRTLLFQLRQAEKRIGVDYTP